MIIRERLSKILKILRTELQNLYTKLQNIRTKLPIGDSNDDDYLAMYRQLSSQLVHSKPDGGSSLLVTPVTSHSVAQCCALLSHSLASVSRQPILLVDLSEEGSRLGDLLGISSERFSSPNARTRLFVNAGQWFIATREGIPMGPYPSNEDATAALAEFIETADRAAALGGQEWTPENFVLPTNIQKFFFLAPAPARLALVRGAYLGDQEKNVSTFLAEFYRRFGYVVFYGGSTLNNPLMLSMVPYVDNVLLASVENRTKTSDLDSARSTLEAFGNYDISPILIRPLVIPK